MSLLVLSNLQKSFVAPDGTRTRVLDVPAFQLEPGEEVGLAGRSGSGKSTLLNVIAGILPPDSGSVVLAGREMTALSEGERDAWRAQQLGYVFQTFNLLQGYSALENVLLGMMFGPGPDRAFAASLLDRLGLKERKDYRPAQMSVGQQQRVALARALANRPKLVLADEPTGNLDPNTAADALTTIRELCREHGAALLIVSHDANVLGQIRRTVDLSALQSSAAAEPAR